MEIQKEKRKPNKKQQECIDNINGKYLVLAGPGTGKTFTITERIKNMIGLGINPEKILCLTYTDAGANEMRKRVSSELNCLETMNIFTYHGFCTSLIEENSELFELPPNYKIISTPASKALLKECIDEIKPKYYRTEKNDPYFYIGKILNQISLIKQNRLTKEIYLENIKQNPDWEPSAKALKEKIDEKIKQGKTNYKTDKDNLEKIQKKINQAQELWQFFELYREKMEKNNYLDFNDMINFVLEEFEKSPSFLDATAKKYDYIMVDEYQDTNKSQNDIVFNLAQICPNIFVVGDSNQIIYCFQGASLDTIDNFKEKFSSELKIIRFEENMRSTQSILNLAHGVIVQDPMNFELKEGLDSVLCAKNEKILQKEKPVRLRKYTDLNQEYINIVDEIEELIKSKECPEKLSEVAILVRSNAEAKDFSEMLKARNIPYQLKEGRDIFEIPAVNALYFYIQFLVNPEMYKARMFQLLTIEPYNINPADYLTLKDEASKSDILDEIFENVMNCKLKEPQKLNDFIETYKYLKEYKSKESLKNIILEIGARTGIFNYYLNSDINKYDNISGIKTFLDEAQGYFEIYKKGFLEDFVEYIETIKQDEDKITTSDAPVALDAVQLLTYHSSKGREFEYVYMPTLIKNKWESNNKSIKPEIPLDKEKYKNADELKETKKSELIKLLYVAITRAKHSLRLSYPEMIDKKSKELTNFLVNAKEYFEIEAMNELDSESYWDEIKKLLYKAPYDYKKEFSYYIDSILDNKDLKYSVTSINQYLRCPRQYLYERLLNLETKDGNPNALSYGSAVHKALELAINKIRNGEYPSKTQFIKWFKDELAKLPMENTKQREIYLGRGEDALDKYYPQLTNLTKNQLEGAEIKFECDFEGVIFKGFIDRVDKNEDNTYTIIDYKTGNNKNADIAPEKDHEDYYNQMAIYKYFYEKLNNVIVSKTKFIYPEDFEKKNDGIEFSEAEVLEVVEKFKQAIKDIKAQKFDPSYDEKACQYCAYASFCDFNRI